MFVELTVVQRSKWWRLEAIMIIIVGSFVYPCPIWESALRVAQFETSVTMKVQ